MADLRHKDGNWGFPSTASGTIESWEYVKIAVLMDLRDELKQLNRVLGCNNFMEVPSILRRIEYNTRELCPHCGRRYEALAAHISRAHKKSE